MEPKQTFIQYLFNGRFGKLGAIAYLSVAGLLAFGVYGVTQLRTDPLTGIALTIFSVFAVAVIILASSRNYNGKQS